MAAHPGRRWLEGLVSQDCVLCGEALGGGLVCPGCEDLLTVIGEACSRCGVALPGGGTCGSCLRAPPPFERLASAYAYRFPLDRLVLRFKHAGDLATGDWLGRRLAQRVRGEPRPDGLVAPPLSSARLRARGFNQSQVLARRIASVLGVPLLAGGVRRIRDTAPQAGLGREARRRNLRGAFACELDLRGRRIAVVDDVVTTGATAEALAEALTAAGVRSVVVWALARTPEPGPPG